MIEYISLNITTDSIWTYTLFDSENNYYNIDTYIEVNAERLRRKYISFIADLSDYEINGKSLAKHFQLKNGHNIWWMSLLAEKSVYKSPRIADCIKLLALEELLLDHKPISLKLYANNTAVIDSIKILCSRLDIEIFNYKSDSSLRKILNFRTIYLKFPHELRAIIFFFKHLFLFVNFNKFKKQLWFNEKNSISIFSYFIHLDKEKISAGEFYSRQWEILPHILNEYKIKTNWIHHYLKSELASNISEGFKIIKKINKDPISNGIHAFLNSYTTISTSWHVIRAFSSFLISISNKSTVKNAFNVTNSQVSLWPLLKEDWQTSFRGTTAIQNLIWIFQIDSALKDMPKQKLGLFLQENQGWERALVTSWRKNGHGTIIGVQHSSLRFWDLRYYDNQRILTGSKKWSQPQPDLIAVNGPYPLKLFLEAGYHENNFICLEALRYLKNNREIRNKIIKKTASNIIILGDILTNSNITFLKMLTSVPKCWESLSIKFHPGAILDINDFSSLSLREERDALNKIIYKFNIAIAIGSTTAALDAYLAGLNVIVFLVDGELNMSPLRNFEDVYFVKNEIELFRGIQLSIKPTLNKSEVDYFWTEKDLPKWKELINFYYQN